MIPNEERGLWVQPHQRVRTDWLSMDVCTLGSRQRLDFAAIERHGRRYLAAGTPQAWPPPVGFWRDGRFHKTDGRHGYLALLALGRETIFVAWLADA